MAKAILKFDLTDADDRIEHLRCVKSEALVYVLWELAHNRRRDTLRHFEAMEERGEEFTYIDVVERVWEELFSLMDDNRIVIDDLII